MQTKRINLKCKLKPCPFCGSEALMFRDPYKQDYYVMCSNVDCPVDLRVLRHNPVLAEKAWNTRCVDKCQDNSN